MEKESKRIKMSQLKEVNYLLKYVLPYKWYLVIGMCLLFLTSMTFMAFPYLMGQLVDVAQGNSDMQIDLKQGAILMAIILLIQGVVSYFRVICFAIVSEKSLADLRVDLYQKLMCLPIVFFEKNKSGELISRIAGDVEKLYSTFSITIAEFIRQLIILITGVMFLLFTTPKLALIMLATFPLIVLAAMFFGRFIRKLSKERQEVFAQTNDQVGESVSAISVVKTFTNEKLELGRFAAGMDRLVDVSLRFAKFRALFAAFIVSVLFGGLMFVFWQGTVMIQNNEITAGDLISFVSYTAILGGAIAGLGNFYSEILGGLGATERVRDILFENQELNEIADFQPDTKSFDPPSVQLQNLSFTYPARPDIEVLKGINMQIDPGQTVALVGPSGAGKSTIVQLLLRLYHDYEGFIEVGGNDAKSYDLANYRSSFGFVPQEVILFGATIAENIRYGNPEATKAQIIEAAKKANAWEFIEQFPEGLETQIGERGVKLSGGQRQRLSIARAILRNPQILILDEATSNLDSESEELVQQALEELMKGRTSIIIAHRLSTIKNADNIFVIKSGEVVEQGRHEELMNKEGLYANLVNLQFDQVGYEG